MFRPIHSSSSGLLTGESVNATHLGSHQVHKDKIRKIHKMLMLVKKVEIGKAVMIPLKSVLFHLDDADS
jgi:hypothetical protein